MSKISKIAPLAEALELVQDGTHLALTGFSISRNAVAATCELIRANRRHLTITQVIGGIETDLLVGSGCVDHLIYSGGSLDRFGPLHSINRAIGNGLRTEEYSTLSLSLRLFAGSMGLPFVPTHSLVGSQLLDPLITAGGAKMTEDPFTGEHVLTLPALRPEVAIVHADLCDEKGNVAIAGPLWTIVETAMASANVIVTAEQIVPFGAIDPCDVKIPGTFVTVVSEVPGGARPTAVFRKYDYDSELLGAYVMASRVGGEVFPRFVADRILTELVM